MAADRGQAQDPYALQPRSLLTVHPFCLLEPVMNFGRTESGERPPRRPRSATRLAGHRAQGILPGHSAPPGGFSRGAKQRSRRNILPANFLALQPRWPPYNFGLAGVSLSQAFRASVGRAFCPPTLERASRVQAAKMAILQSCSSGRRPAARRARSPHLGLSPRSLLLLRSDDLLLFPQKSA